MKKFCVYRRNEGFSVVELVVVLGMAAALAALSVPLFNGAVRDMKLDSDARSIATTITYAKSSAISRLTRYEIRFDLSANSWTLSRLNRAVNPQKWEVENSEDISSGIASNGVTLIADSVSAPPGFGTSSSTSITFDSRGLPMNGPAIIYLSRGDLNYAISVSTLGAVELWRSDGESCWGRK